MNILKLILLTFSMGVLFITASNSYADNSPKWLCEANTDGDKWVCKDYKTGQQIPKSISTSHQQNEQSNLSNTRESEIQTAVNPATKNEELIPVQTENKSDTSVSSITGSISPRIKSNSVAYQYPQTEWDWICKEMLNKEDAVLPSKHCNGRFISPLKATSSIKQNENLLPIHGSADRLKGVINKSLIFENKVILRQGDNQLQSDSAVYDKTTNTVTLQGNVRYRKPGLLLKGDTAVLDNTSKSTYMENAQYVLHNEHIHGSAQQIAQQNKKTAITEGTYTRCEPDRKSWELEGGEITLDQKSGTGTAKNVTLKIADFPVLYFPYFSFPINDQRRSGFLTPTLESSNNGGVDIALPYYWNMATHYDATLIPRWISDRGLMLESEFRYLSQNSLNTFNLAYLANDDEFPNDKNLLQEGQQGEEDRWLLNFKHFSGPGSRWSSRVDYSAVSDMDYFRDLDSVALSLRKQSLLPRIGELRYRGDSWYLSGRVQAYQIIDPNISELGKPYRRLPQLEFHQDFYSSSGLIEGSIDSEYVWFDRNFDRELTTTEITNGKAMTGKRFHIEPGIKFPFEWSSGFFIPASTLKYTRYSLKDQAGGIADSPNRTVWVNSIDAGLFFERHSDGFIQTLEPRIFYLNSRYGNEDEQILLPIFDTTALSFNYNQLFRDDRFIGGDRIGDTEQLAVGLSSRFLSTKGHEIAKLSLGQIYYFKDRLISLSGIPDNRHHSAIVGEFIYRAANDWRVISDVVWDEEMEKVEQASVQFRYWSDYDPIVNMAYRYRRRTNNLITGQSNEDIIEQGDISTIWPLNDQWSVIGRWNYDVSNKRTLESIAGIEYNTCCWRLRLVHRRWVDSDKLTSLGDENKEGVFIQVELKGLGNLSGNRVDNILDEAIIGYRERETNEQ